MTMLQVDFIREHPDVVKTKIAQKNKKPQLVDDFLAVDKQWRETTGKIDAMRFEQRKLGEQKKIEEAKALKEDVKKLEEQIATLESDRTKLLYQIPNLQFDDIPVGKSEDDNIVIRKWGEPTKFDFTPKDHMELGEALDIIDTKKASEVSGARFNYLKGEAALLEFAIVQYVFSVLTNKEIIATIAKSVSTGLSTNTFVPVVPPVMIRPEIYVRMARLDPGQEEERFHMPNDNLYLIGSAEHTLGPIHMDEIIDEKKLPIRYIGFSTAFRREAGSYGKDTKGILRVHQFDKLEMESFSTPETSRQEQDFFVAIQEYLLQGLKLPYQVISVCTGDMGGPDARQIDMETWMPGQNRYRETHTSDLMTDYQSRRLNTKVRRQDGTTELVHMNDATAFAIGRILIAILENYQQADGSVLIPEVLQKYLGLDKIERRNNLAIENRL